MVIRKGAESGSRADLQGHDQAGTRRFVVSEFYENPVPDPKNNVCHATSSVSTALRLTQFDVLSDDVSVELTTFFSGCLAFGGQSVMLRVRAAESQPTPVLQGSQI